LRLTLRLGLGLRLGRLWPGPGRDRAVDGRFDDDVGRTADQEKVLDIVPPHENEAPAPVNRKGVDQGQPGGARGSILADNRAAAIAGDQPDDHRDQRQDDK
jgi:hypothetical protein